MSFTGQATSVGEKEDCTKRANKAWMKVVMWKA